MRAFITLSFIFIFNAIAFGQSLVNVKFSKPFAIIKFLETAKGGHGISQTFRHQIDTSATGKDPKFKKLVIEYSSLNLDYAYSKDQYPQKRKHVTSTWDLLCIAAISSNTNEEFFERIIGYFPNTDYIKLKRIYLETETYYNTLVYNKNRDVIADKVQELKALSPKLNELFDAFKLFYGSSWDKSIPFNLTIYPIEGNRGQTTATPHANSLEMGILTKDDDNFSNLAIGMHEICHVLYDEQPLNIQQMIDSVYTDSIQNPYHMFAYRYIDEALATAIGNGYAYKYLTTEIDSGEWYNDYYINSYAKALYPMVEEYLVAKKQIDRAFVKKAIDVFAKTFPRAIYDLEPLLINVDIYFDADDAEERHFLGAAIGNTFRVYSSTTSTPINDPIALDIMSQSPETQLIIVHKNQLQNMTLLKTKFKKLAKLPVLNNAVISFLDTNKRAVIIILAQNKAKAVEGIKLLKQQKEINPQKMWFSF